MAQNMALRRGSSVSGRRLSERVSAVGADAPRSMPAMPSRLPRLAAIASAAGAFSALFGVGGGTVVVPLLILWMGYGEREATGTSLAAIVLIVGVAALAQGAFGNVHVDDALLVGIPAVGGVVAGTWLQQRVPPRAVSLLFAALLVATAVDMFAGGA